MGGPFPHGTHVERWQRLLLSRAHRSRDEGPVRVAQEKHFLKGLSPEQFAREAACFLSTLNAIHPFREGNGRTQTTFLALLAERAGHPLHLDRLEPEQFLAAMVASFKGDDGPLERQILMLSRP
jgi:cell filamentation protein